MLPKHQTLHLKENTILSAIFDPVYPTLAAAESISLHYVLTLAWIYRCVKWSSFQPHMYGFAEGKLLYVADLFNKDLLLWQPALSKHGQSLPPPPPGSE